MQQILFNQKLVLDTDKTTVAQLLMSVTAKSFSVRHKKADWFVLTAKKGLDTHTFEGASSSMFPVTIQVRLSEKSNGTDVHLYNTLGSRFIAIFVVAAIVLGVLYYTQILPLAVAAILFVAFGFCLVFFRRLYSGQETILLQKARGFMQELDQLAQRGR